MKKPSWFPAAVLLAALLALPTTAQATLAFVRKPFNPQVWVANDNGKQAHKLVAGSNPSVSPDGDIVALLHQRKGRSAQPELVLAPADRSAPPSTLVKGWRDLSVFAWSPDSKSVAVVLGPELGKQRLVLIDTENGSQTTIARGYFNGVSFDPQGGYLVYGMAPSERFPPRSDVYSYRIDIGHRDRLTSDHRSLDPLWDPREEIVFVKQLGAKKRKYGPKNELFKMNPAGGMVGRLTHSKVPPLAQGLYPTATSANGVRLLAQFEGQDLSYAVTVDEEHGGQRPLVKATEQGVIGIAVSPNGKYVIGTTGGFDPGSRHNVVKVPWKGGRPRVLVRNAFEASVSGGWPVPPDAIVVP
jgi:hypothetical protein